MHSTVANAAWATITAADPGTLGRDGLAGLLSSIEHVRRVCAAVEVQALRRSRDVAARGSGDPPDNLLAAATGDSARRARTATKRAQACEEMPELEGALASGKMSLGHVDAAAAAHARLEADVAAAFAEHAPDLASRAESVSVDAFERECRELARHLQRQADTDAEVAELDRQRASSRVKRWVDRATGMHNTLISLDPLRDSQMWKRIRAEVARERQRRSDQGEPSLSFDALQAAAVVAAVTAEPGESGPANVPEVGIFIDHDT